MASQSTLLGAAGEHYVMSELLRRDYIAALAPTGVPHADIVVTDLEGARLCAIQVKTRRAIGSDGGWHMQEKVADVLTRSHEAWLAAPGKDGRPHNPTKMRRLLPDYARIFGADNPYPFGWLSVYRDAWDRLKLEDPDQRSFGAP